MREGTPDAMSLCYEETSLPGVLIGRPSLCYAEMSICNTSKCAGVIQEVFSLNKRFFSNALIKLHERFLKDEKYLLTSLF